MASKGLRAISYQDTRNVEAGYNPSHTTETLIGYTACWQLGIYIKPILVKVIYLNLLSDFISLSKLFLALNHPFFSIL